MAFERAKIEGLKELDEKLAALDTVVSTRLGAAATRKSGVAMRDALIAAAPYDPTHRVKSRRLKSGEVRTAYYGHLRDNIRLRKARSRKKTYVVYEITTGDAFWGNFQEFGTVKMPARPWARPTVEREKDEVVSIQIATLGKGIERAARKQARAIAAAGEGGA